MNSSKALVALLTVVACCWAIPLESTTAPPPPPPAGSNSTKPGNSSSDPIKTDSLPGAENITAELSGLDPKIISALTENVTDDKLLDRIIECGLLTDPNYKKNETKVVPSAEVLSACGNLTLSNTTADDIATRATKKPTDKSGTTPAPKKDAKDGAEKKPEAAKKTTRRDVTPKVESNSTLPAHNKTDELKVPSNQTDCDEQGNPLVKGDLNEQGNSTAKNETLKPDNMTSAKNETLKPDNKTSAKNETLKPDNMTSAKNETLNSTTATTAATTTTQKPASRRRRDAYGSSEVRVQEPAVLVRSSGYESVLAPVRALRVRAHRASTIVRDDSYEPAVVREVSYGAPAIREEIVSVPALREDSYNPAVVIRESSSSGYEAASPPVRTLIRSDGY